MSKQIIGTDRKTPTFILCKSCGGSARKLYYQTKTSRTGIDVGYCSTCKSLTITREEIQACHV